MECRQNAVAGRELSGEWLKAQARKKYPKSTTRLPVPPSLILSKSAQETF